MEKREYLVLAIVVILLFVCMYYINFINAQGQVGLGIGGFPIFITSPENITYTFNITDNYTINLNVSSTRNIVSWNYTYYVNESIVTNITSFSPNTSIITQAGRNYIFIKASDNFSNFGNVSVSFTVNVTNRAPIIDGLDDLILVCENRWLSTHGFPIPYFNITEPDEQSYTYGLVNPDPFYVGYVSDINSSTKSYDIFSGTLSKSDAGGIFAGSRNYSLYVYASDSQYTDNKYFNITVIEVNNVPLISNIGVQTIWTNTSNNTFNYTVDLTDIEDGDRFSGNISFNISFTGSDLFSIDNDGIINFTANDSHLGVHDISICAIDNGIPNPHQNISICGQDGGSLFSCENFSLTVTSENRQPQFINWTPYNLSVLTIAGSYLTFEVIINDPDGTIPDVYWYIDNESIEYDTGELNQNFSYTVPCGVAETYNYSVIITDGELNNSLNWTVVAAFASCPVPGTGSSGGGGGGGSSKEECIEKWACRNWKTCNNLREAEITGNNVFGLIGEIRKRCDSFSWTEDICGYQLRECKDIEKCGNNKSELKPGEARECYYSVDPSCFDGIKNCHNDSCEVLIDCSGPCKACPTCSDRIKNQGEKGVDCGGPCKVCVDEEPKKKIFDYTILVIPLLILVILLGLAIATWLVYGYIIKKKKLKESKRSKRGF
ncbi:hypothetical protein GOV12_00260 [Candidatus Pacearchaeota archaeon]|nr:hypothetical protein [Candidatus Pacearchaeota archaeon]